MCRDSDEVLQNFLEALPLANALPKRIFVQFGQKWFGVHLGATAIPRRREQIPVSTWNQTYTTRNMTSSPPFAPNMISDGTLPSHLS